MKNLHIIFECQSVFLVENASNWSKLILLLQDITLHCFIHFDLKMYIVYDLSVLFIGQNINELSI